MSVNEDLKEHILNMIKLFNVVSEIDLDVEFDDFLDTAAEVEFYGEEAMAATIKFNLRLVESKDEATKIVIHELLHLFVYDMRFECEKHISHSKWLRYSHAFINRVIKFIDVMCDNKDKLSKYE